MLCARSFFIGTGTVFDSHFAIIMMFRLGQLLLVAAMPSNTEALKTSACTSTDVSGGDEIALLTQYFARSVRRSSANVDVEAELTTRVGQGGKWKFGGEFTPGGRSAKLKMLKSRLRRLKKKATTAKHLASQPQPYVVKQTVWWPGAPAAPQIPETPATSSQPPASPSLPEPTGVPSQPPTTPGQQPLKTTSGCACRSEWSYGHSASPIVCTDGCCNPDNDAAGHWCAVVDPGCQGANWGYCADSEESSSLECVDTDAGASDLDGDVCWQYSAFPKWCEKYDDDDFTSSVMCCACGGGRAVEQQAEASPSLITGASGVCTDTDDAASDGDGDYCWAYADHPQWCGGYDDDDFISASMCCACGGGADNSVLKASSDTVAKASCTSTDESSTGDMDGDHCVDYSHNPQWCTDGNFGDEDFNAFTMCCACGGGTLGKQAVTELSSSCVDLDEGSTGDEYGDHCAEYSLKQSWCLGDFGDEDFEALTMCCACGGGSGGVSSQLGSASSDSASGPFSHSLSSCIDGDADSNGDHDGDKCVNYSSHPDWCQGNFGDEDFNAPSMCCVCGGGSSWADHIF